VKFLGLTNDIAESIKNSDLIVFPSTKAHQPRPIIEAGYYRKTAILSDFHQTQFYYINDYNVITFKHTSSRDLARKINWSIMNSDLLKTYGFNNYLMSLKHHNYEIEKQKMIDSIYKIINEEETNT
jgi:hypothetical protein